MGGWLQGLGQEELPLPEGGLGWEGWRAILYLRVQGRSEGSWLVWVLPLAGAGTEVLVVAWGRGEQVGRGRSVGRGSLTRMR